MRQRNLSTALSIETGMNTAAVTNACYWTEVARTKGAGSNRLQGDLEADVAIIGAGIVGTIAARLLKDRGRKVALIEAGRAGCGVTGRSTAKVTAQHSTYLQRIEYDHGAQAASIYADANRAGVKLIGELVRQHGVSCDLEPADSWVYAQTEDGARKLKDEFAAADRAGLPMEFVNQLNLPFGVRTALRLRDQLQFQPVDFVAKLAATITGNGSFLFEHSRVTEWSETEVATADGRVHAQHVIMATHLPLAAVGLFYSHTTPRMHAVMAVPVAAPSGPAGMYISVDEPHRSLRWHRTPDGTPVLILTGPRFTHGNAQEEAAAFGELEDFARQKFNWRGGGYRWSNEDYTPADGLPYVGWSGTEGKSVLVATGFDAWGLSNGATAGMILADLCEGRENSWAGCFDASRHTLKGISQMATDAVQAVRGLVSDHVHKPPAPSSPEEGAIVYIDGRASGIYRDTDGRFQLVSAVCTHMGCMLGWNPVDGTWDCPCHGSRFARDGKVVHGPATKPLEAVVWPGEQGKD